MIVEGERLWDPRPAFSESSNVVKYMAWLAAEKDLSLADYHALWQWSVSDLPAFWRSIWDYFEVHAYTEPTAVLGNSAMPTTVTGTGCGSRTVV